jgi:hypothetical protein
MMQISYELCTFHYLCMNHNYKYILLQNMHIVIQTHSKLKRRVFLCSLFLVWCVLMSVVCCRCVGGQFVEMF